MESERIVDYWTKSSDDDYQVMHSLFNNGHYVWALFMAHLVIEKLLKAYFVMNVNTNYPRIHDLVEIANKATLNLTPEQKEFLEDLSTFNLRARYPDYKNRFKKMATRKYTEAQLAKVRDIRQWLQEKINS